MAHLGYGTTRRGMVTRMGKATVHTGEVVVELLSAAEGRPERVRGLILAFGASVAGMAEWLDDEAKAYREQAAPRRGTARAQDHARAAMLAKLAADLREGLALYAQERAREARRPCLRCLGTGVTWGNRACPHCGGTGRGPG